MKKILSAFVLLALCLHASAQENYAGFGGGYSEACRTKYSPGFAGGDCIEANVAIRGLVGHSFNEYFSVEGAFDFSFDGGHITDEILNAVLSDATNGALSSGSSGYDSYVTNRWSIATLSVAAFAHLPLTRNFKLFAGPTLGGSAVSFDYDVKYFGNPYSRNQSESEFGLNYGGAFGAEFVSSDKSVIRLQWQNWRSLDTNMAVNGQFNSNTFTVNFISNF